MKPIRTPTIKTVGHSSHPIGRFVELLQAAGVERLVDVRSTPWSRRHPQFGKEALAKALAEAGIGCLHEGAALGGKPAAGGSYDALAARPAFTAALGRVVAAAKDTTLCLMCAEKEPMDCHRTVLVSRRLAERGVAVEHLLADGTVRSHLEIEEMLLGGESAGDLFDDRPTRLARAWVARERAMKRGA